MSASPSENTVPGLIRDLDRTALLREAPDHVRGRAERQTK